MSISRPRQTIRHTAVVLAGAASLTLTVLAGSYIVHQLPTAAEAEDHIVDFSAPPAPILRADRAADHGGQSQRALPISSASATQGPTDTAFTSAFNTTSRWQSTAATVGPAGQQREHNPSDRAVAGTTTPVSALGPTRDTAEPLNTFQPQDATQAPDTPARPPLAGTGSTPDGSAPGNLDQGGRWDLGPAYLDARMDPGDDTVAVTVGSNTASLRDGANNTPAAQLRGRMDAENPGGSVHISDPSLGEHGVELGGNQADGDSADNATITRGNTEPTAAAEQSGPTATEDGTDPTYGRNAPLRVAPEALRA